MYEVVPLDARHVGAMERIEYASFSSPWSRKMLEDELVNRRAVYFVAEDGGAVLGYAGMHVVLDTGYVTNVAVTPAFRRMGIARSLMERLIAEARDRELRDMTLEVRQSNYAAAALYESLGFTKAGRRRAYYTKPVEDAFIMTLYLGEDTA